MNLLDRLPFNDGNKSTAELISDLLYVSYASLVDRGMTHTQARQTFALPFEVARRFYHMYICREFNLLNKN